MIMNVSQRHWVWADHVQPPVLIWENAGSLKIPCSLCTQAVFEFPVTHTGIFQRTARKDGGFEQNGRVEYSENRKNSLLFDRYASETGSLVPASTAKFQLSGPETG